MTRAMLFSPPYGDGTYEGVDFWQNIKFSPPYGDRTKAFCFPVCYDRFSPPYGDCTMNNSKKRHDGGFSPPYRDCTGLRVDGNNGWFVFAPLRGLYPKYITKHRKTEETDG